MYFILMDFFKRILLNRNSILVLAVVAGVILGNKAVYLKEFSFIALGLSMTFSMTGISLNSFRSIREISKPALMAIFLNYIIFTAVLLTAAWFIIPDKTVYYGFVVIAAAPPGVAIIPFSYILKGKVDYAIIGVTFAFISSLFFAPLIVNSFTTGQGISKYDLFLLMVQLIVVPLIVSQFLRLKPIFKYIEPIRGKVVDFGFAVIIFVAVGMNRDIFFTDLSLLIKIIIVLLIATLGIGTVFEMISRLLHNDKSLLVTQNMLVTIKSSGFSVFTSISLFGKEAAIPSAVLAIIVLIYLIYLSLRFKDY